VTAVQLRGAPIAKRLKDEVLASAEVLRQRGGLQPTLATLLVGGNPSAEAYRRSIERSLGSVGIIHRARTLPETTSDSDLIAEVQSLNGDPAVNGVLILMPLPEHLSPHLIIEHLSPLKDVDGITPTNAGRLHLGIPSLRPSPPQGRIERLAHYEINLVGQQAVVVGRSNVVGRPLSTLLTLRDATVTVCHRKTRDLASVTRQADIVAVAAGHPGLIRGDMIRDGAIVIDFGVNVVDGVIVGDVDPASVASVAAAYTPVPGGTGPVTTLVLARNTIAAGFAALGGSLDHVELATVTGRAQP